MMASKPIAEDSQELDMIVSNYPRSADPPLPTRSTADALWAVQTHTILGFVLLVLSSGMRLILFHVSIAAYVPVFAVILSVATVCVVSLCILKAKKRLRWSLASTAARLLLALLGLAPFIGIIPLLLLQVLTVREARRFGFPTNSLYLKEKDLSRALESGSSQ